MLDTFLTTAGEGANSVFEGHFEQTRAFQGVESAQPDTRAAVYIYSPLLAGDIRLLQILPSTTDSSPLRFNLIHVPLLTARARRYTALSYVWGAGAATRTVLLDEKEVKIRPNLAHILRIMRSLHYEFVWVCPPPYESP